MSYLIETRLTSKEKYDTPAEARKRYGRYSRTGIVCHHWNSPDKIKDSDHDNLVNYYLNTKPTSINYIVSNTKITKMVEPDDVAWHAQSGNPDNIGIEFSPHLNNDGYKRGGWLISELEKQFGSLKLKKHNEFVETSCQDTVSLTRLRQEADNFKKGNKMANEDQIRILLYSVLGLDGKGIGVKRLNALDRKDAQVQKIVDSYKDRSVETLLSQFWGSGQAKAYRDKEIAQVYLKAEGYDKSLPALKDQIKTLQDQLAEMPTDASEAEKKLQQIKEALDIGKEDV